MNRLIESLGTPRHASERVEMRPGDKISVPSRQTAPASKCAECGASYARTRKYQTFCSQRCRKASWDKERKIRPSYDIRAKLDAISARLDRIEEKLGKKEE